MKLTTTGKLFSVVAGVSMSAMVSATTTFVPTDGNVNTFDISGFLPSDDATFAIFDADDKNDLGSATGLILETFDQVTFLDVGGNWVARNENNDSLDLGENPRFIIAADSGSGYVGGDAINYIVGPLPNATFVSFGTDEPQLAAVDLTAVPVPAAVWLFGSGLLGLVGVARRKSA